MNSKTPIVIITIIGITGILATYTTISSLKEDFSFLPSGVRQNTNTTGGDQVNYDPKSAPQFGGNIKMQETPEPMEKPKSEAQEKFEEILATDTSTVCNINQVEEGQQVNGKLYIKNKNIMAEFTLTKEGTVYDSNLLKLDKTVYIWSKTNNMGYQFAVENDDEVFSLKDLELLTSDTGYDCTAMDISDVIFTVPSNVTFQSFGENLDQLINNKESLCAICDNSPNDSARQTCRQQLECDQ